MEYSDKIDDVKQQHENEVKKQEEHIAEKHAEIREIEDNSRQIKRQLRNYRRYQENPAKYATTITQKIVEKGYCTVHRDIHEFFAIIKSEYAPRLTNHLHEERSLAKQLEITGQKIAFIESLQEMSVEQHVYQIIPLEYEKAIKKFYTAIVLVDKQSMNTFFPKTRRIESEFELSKILLRKEDYCFCMDFTQELIKFKEEKERLESEIQTYQIAIEQEKQSIAERLGAWLHTKINKLEEEQGRLEQKYQQEQKELIAEQEKLTAIRNHNPVSQQQQIRALQREQKAQRYEIMREKKGLYTLSWKYARDVWLEADCPVFFDIGEEYLFEFDHLRTLRKVPKNELINTWRNETEST